MYEVTWSTNFLWCLILLLLSKLKIFVCSYIQHLFDVVAHRRSGRFWSGQQNNLSIRSVDSLKAYQRFFFVFCLIYSVLTDFRNKNALFCLAQSIGKDNPTPFLDLRWPVSPNCTISIDPLKNISMSCIFQFVDQPLCVHKSSGISIFGLVKEMSVHESEWSVHC